MNCQAQNTDRRAHPGLCRRTDTHQYAGLWLCFTHERQAREWAELGRENLVNKVRSRWSCVITADGTWMEELRWR